MPMHTIVLAKAVNWSDSEQTIAGAVCVGVVLLLLAFLAFRRKG